MNGSSAIVESRRVAFIESKNFYLRELTVADASERMASWFDQPDVRNGINVEQGKMSKSELETYIRRFDQRNRILLGIFDKYNDLIVGFLSADINWKLGRYLVSMVIGEESYRNSGVTLAVSPAFRHYFFEVLGLKVMTATALATNKPIARYLKKTGWELNHVIPKRIRCHADGSDVDLHFYSLTRESWNKWMSDHPDQLQAMLDDVANSARHGK